MNLASNAEAATSDSPTATEFDPARRAAQLRRLDLKSELAFELIEHWLKIAGDQIMPRKSDLDPSAIKAALPFVTMHEHVRDDLIRFRIVGTGLMGIYGKDMTNRNYFDYVKEGGRATAIARLKVLTEQPCGLKTEVIGPCGHDLNVLYETTGFPLADENDRMRWMIYVAEPVQRAVHEERARQAYLNAAVPEYIDIGAGVPKLPDAVLS